LTGGVDRVITLTRLNFNIRLRHFNVYAPEASVVLFVLRHVSEEVITVHVVVDTTHSRCEIIGVVNQEATGLIRKGAETATRIEAQEIFIALERSKVRAGATSIVTATLLRHTCRR